MQTMKTRLALHQKEQNDEDGGEVIDGVECEENLSESDWHSIELNMDSNNKNYN